MPLVLGKSFCWIKVIRSEIMEFVDYQKKYPNLFREYPRSGFGLSKGWEALANVLCDVLEREISKIPEEVRVHVYCVQVKEKFGTLRWYMSSQTPVMDGAIAVAELMSGNICEYCGMPGKLRAGSWILTLCDEHSSTKE